MPNFYSPYQQYPQQFPQQYPQYNSYPAQQQSQQNQTPQIQNGGFLSAPNEEFARNYPVGLGNSVTFKDENAPYVYTKTMGFSQLESPRFEKYKLIKEDAVIPSNSPDKDDEDKKAMNDTIDGLISDIEEIKEEIRAIKEKLKSITKSTGKRPVKEDDDDE